MKELNIKLRVNNMKHLVNWVQIENKNGGNGILCDIVN